MAFYDAPFVRFSQILLTIWSWLVQGVLFLACSLEPRQPSHELPISTVVVPAELTAPGDETRLLQDHIEVPVNRLNCGPLIEYKLPRNDLERNRKTKERDFKRKKHADKRVDRQTANHGESDSESAASLMSNFADTLVSPNSFTYTPSVFSLPSSLSSSICSSSANITTDHSEPCLGNRPGENVLVGVGLNISVGELGKRRGFKGAPLFTEATRRSSSFLSLPPSFSPRTPVTRSPLATVTSFIRTTTPKSSKFSTVNYTQVSQDVQDSFYLDDPFHSRSESYFALDSWAFPTANLENFEPYLFPTRKPKTVSELTAAKSTMKTALYDMSIHEVPVMKFKNAMRPVKASVDGAESESVREMAPLIALIPPSPPQSPRKADLIAETVSMDIVNPLSAVLEPLVLQVHLPNSLAALEPLCEVEEKQSTKKAVLVGGLSPPTTPTNSSFPSRHLDNESSSKSLIDLRNSTPEKEATPDLKSNIYEFLVHDIPAKTPRKTKPTKAPISPPATPVKRDRKPLKTDSSPSSILQDVSNRPHPQQAPLLDDDDVFAPSPVPVPPPTKRSSALRPLVLPLRLAKRNITMSARFSAPPAFPPQAVQPSAASAPLAGENRRSRALDDLIAILEGSVVDLRLGDAEKDLSEDSQSVSGGYVAGDHCIAEVGCAI